MASFLSEINPDEISLCKTPVVTGAFKRLIKSMGNDRIETAIYPIHKNIDKGEIYFYPLISGKEDLQGHITDNTEIRKAVDNYNYNRANKLTKGNGVGYNHQDFSGDYGDVMISVFDDSGAISDAIGIKKADILKTWLLGIKLTEKGIQEVQKGNITAVSIAGKGVLSDIGKSSTESENKEGLLEKLFKKLDDLFPVKPVRTPEPLIKSDYDMKDEIKKVVSETVIFLKKQYDDQIAVLTKLFQAQIDDLKKSVEPILNSREGSSQDNRDGDINKSIKSMSGPQIVHMRYGGTQ